MIKISNQIAILLLLSNFSINFGCNNDFKLLNNKIKYADNKRKYAECFFEECGNKENHEPKIIKMIKNVEIDKVLSNNNIENDEFKTPEKNFNKKELNELLNSKKNYMEYKNKLQKKLEEKLFEKLSNNENFKKTLFNNN